jgi:endonuclease/exonuclease/phosphatase family metal-dependent hydrolase
MGIDHSRRRRLVYPVPLLLLALAVTATAQAEPFAILSQNMNRLFDDVDDGNRETVLPGAVFRGRVEDAATRFAVDFGMPHIIALQEVENQHVLRRIAARIRQRHGVDYQTVLISGQDLSSINTGFLVREGVQIRRVEQLFRGRLLPDDGTPLFSRPPLRLDACYRARCATFVNLHLRSMRGIDTAERVARKRRRQAETLAAWVDRIQQADPAAGLVLLGDFNALTPADEHVDVAGILRGAPDNSRVRLRARDLVERDLIDLTRRIPAARRYSYIFRQRKQQLDYLFVSEPLAGAVTTIAYSRIDYRFSDHAGLLATLDW